MGRRLRIVERVAGTAPEELVLGRDNVHYLRRVLRADEGDTVEVVPGDGRLLAGVFAPTTRNDARLRQLSLIRSSDSPPQMEIWAALIKPSRWDILVEKAAELGATRLVPMLTERSASPPPPRRLSNRMQRWREIVSSGIRQSERLWSMEVCEPTELSTLLSLRPSSTSLFFADEGRAGPWEVPPELGLASQRILVVGPAGGFSEAERSAISEHAAGHVALGPHLLRAETAVSAFLTLAGYAAQQAQQGDGSPLASRGE